MEQEVVEKIPQEVQEEESFPILRPLENQEAEKTFVLYLSSSLSAPTAFVDLYTFFGSDFFLFLSLFAGKNLRIPRMASLLKFRDYCIVYTFLYQGSFLPETYQKAETLFGKKTVHLRGVVRKVDRIIARIKKGAPVEEN